MGLKRTSHLVAMLHAISIPGLLVLWYDFFLMLRIFKMVLDFDIHYDKLHNEGQGLALPNPTSSQKKECVK